MVTTVGRNIHFINIKGTIRKTLSISTDDCLRVGTIKQKAVVMFEDDPE